MQLNDYQAKAVTTVADTGDKFMNTVAFMLGLAGEAGEVVDKYKKIVRDQHGVIEPHDVDSLEKELGDVLWYVAVIADDLGISLEAVAEKNLTKLFSRQQRGVISGSGDNR